MKNRVKVILGIISIFLFALVLTGCKNNTTTSTAKNTNTTSGTELVDDSEQYKIYKIASSSGYTGTYEEWLESIRGDSITLQVNDGYIEWKYSKDTTWTKL